jgi:DNA-binding SARP family transcriptional activator/tetratricopeptide (TPR) repeat protein
VTHLRENTAPPARLRLRVLGPFEVEGVPAEGLGSRKARTLLKVLALARGQPVSVDRLVDAGWGAAPPARPGDQVAVLVSRLRGVLGRERLSRRDAGYALAFDWLDLDAVEQLAGEASARLRAAAYPAARTAVGAALVLARGPLLVDEPDAEWAEIDRAAVERLVTRLRLIGAEASLAVGDLSDAAELAEATLDRDAYDEHAMRLLMTARAAGGRPASALAGYARLRARLGDDLGVDPSPETEALHTAIVRGEPLPGVVVASPAPGTARARVRGRSAGLPGRADVLDALDNALDRATRERTVLVELAGEAGIGKTAVLGVWSARALDEGVTVLRGSCDELERSLPLQAVLDALDDHITAVGPDAAETLLGSDQPVLARLLAGASEPAHGRAPPAIPEDVVGPNLLFGALLSVLGRTAADGPTALLLDDVHLAGPATFDWLRYVTRRGREQRLLVVAARRSEEGPRLPSDHRIELGPLDVAAAAEIVGKERAAELQARSGGHPLFLVELAAADPADELPTSLRDAVASRCDRAGAAAPTLRAAALLGSPVDLDLLAGVTNLPAIELLRHLDEGVRRHILEEQGAQFVFRHELVRAAMAADASSTRAAFVHREAARVLAARPGADPLEVAYHARLGGDEATAAHAFGRAAVLASERYDYVTAERLLDRSLALADSATSRLERAKMRMLQGRYAESVSDAEEALRAGAGAPALEVAGWASYWAREGATAQRLADDGVELADGQDTRASCLILAGRIRHAGGDLPGAEDRLIEALGLAQGPQHAVASAWLGVLRSHQSRVVEALDLLHAATRPGDAARSVNAHLHALMFTGHALALAGRPAAALAALDQYRDVVARTQLHRFAGRAENFSGWILRSLGEEREANDENLAALDVVDTVDVAIPETAIAAHLDLAEGRLMAGVLAEAGRELDAAEALLGSVTGDLVFGWRLRFKARWHRARLALADGRPEETEHLADALATDASALGVPRYAVPARLLRARARALLGSCVDLEEAATCVEALPHAVALESWWLVAEAARDLGVGAWFALAEEHAERLARQAGDHGDTLRRRAGSHLEALRSAPRP